MSRLGKNRVRKPKKGTAGDKDHTGPRKPKKAAQVDAMIRRFEEKVNKDEVDLTVGEYIRLIQLREELGPEEPKEIKVTWVEPIEKEPATET